LKRAKTIAVWLYSCLFDIDQNAVIMARERERVDWLVCEMIGGK